MNTTTNRSRKSEIVSGNRDGFDTYCSAPYSNAHSEEQRVNNPSFFRRNFMKGWFIEMCPVQRMDCFPLEMSREAVRSNGPLSRGSRGRDTTDIRHLERGQGHRSIRPSSPDCTPRCSGPRRCLPGALPRPQSLLRQARRRRRLPHRQLRLPPHPRPLLPQLPTRHPRRTRHRCFRCHCPHHHHHHRLRTFHAPCGQLKDSGNILVRAVFSDQYVRRHGFCNTRRYSVRQEVQSGRMVGGSRCAAFDGR